MSTIEHKHKFSSTQIQLPKSIGAIMARLAAEIPDTELAQDGREDDHHVTVKYGLHTNQVADVRAILKDEPPVAVRFGKTSLFDSAETKNDYDVVKVVVESGDLKRLNAKISKALEVTDTYPTYKPHATIAYVKAGRGYKYSGRDDLVGEEVIVDTVYFSNKDGDKIPISLGGDRIESAIARSIAK